MDLNAPLGMDPPPKPRHWRVWMGFAGAAFLALAASAAFLASLDSGAKAPFVVAAIPSQIVEKAPKLASPSPASTDAMATGSIASPAKADPAGSNAAGSSAALNGATVENGVKVVRAAPEAARVEAHGPLIIDVSRALDAGHHSTKPSASGEPPSSQTSSSQASGNDRSPKIALFVEGMGLGTTATQTAIETMPPAVDLAFVPYGATVAGSVASAKAKGHEILLQLPMENGGHAGSLGPHMLRPDMSAAAFDDDMRWLTGQYSGYAGVANLLGAPVTANASTMTAVLKAVAARGLFYVDDGTSKRSLATSLAGGLDVPVLKADVVLDATPDETKVRANLDSLVALAKAKGTAIGMASGLPDHLALIATFARDLGSRGVTLVPVSALAAHPVSTATTR